MRVAYALAAILCVGLLAGCGSKSSCKKTVDDPAAPCQNVTTANDAGAVGTPQCYVNAQICPGLGGFALCERPVLQSFRQSLEITNTGESVLTIYSVVAHGNAGCAFVDPELRDPDGGVPLNVNPQEMILLSFRFEASDPVEYDAMLEITSNAENFPVLKVTMCGLGVEGDAGVNPIDDAGVQHCGLPVCKDMSSAAPTACGWERLAGSGG